MNVKLIGFSPNPEKMPAMAAKLTHSKTKPEDLDKTSDKELKGILEYVMGLGHTSVIEHTCFTFAISDVSRVLTHQLVRHRIASYAQQSERYNQFFENEINILNEQNKKYSIDKKRRKECKLSLGDEYRICDEYREGKSSIELGKKYKCNPETILNILKAHVEIVRGNNEVVVNHNFFDSINNHIKAQILGVFFADGFIGKYNENYLSGIKLQEPDKEYLDSMRNILELKRPLTCYPPEKDNHQYLYQLSVSSKKIYDNLKKYGMKKGIRNPPKNLDEKYVNSFILGFFEGDGSVGNVSDYKYWLTFVSISSKFLEYIKKYVEKNCKVNNVNILKKNNAFYLSWQGKRDIEKILSWMYKDISLDFVMKRKFYRSCTLFKSIEELRKKLIVEKCDQYNSVIPYSILNNIKASDIFLKAQKELITSYISSCGLGVKAEDSRFILPQSFKTNIIVTMNARSLLNFFELRTCQHAQWEIRELANKMLQEVKKVAPTIFKNAGPSCKTKNICHENKKDCPLYPK